MKILTGLIVGVFLLGSCCNREVKRVAYLQEEVMRVHDSIMPLSGELMRLKRECSRMYAEDSVRSAEFIDASLALDAAYFAMMEWMQEYMVPDNDAPVDEKLAHFEDEMRKIRSVGRRYEESMRNARELLNEESVTETSH